MRIFTFLVIFLFCGKTAFGVEYLNASTLDIVQYERGLTTAQRNQIIEHAFATCTNPYIQQYFKQASFFDATTSQYLTNDSLRLSKRYVSSCVMDLDGDGEREVLFHERNADKNLQLAVILKRNLASTYDVVFEAYGVFSGLTFESRMLKRIHVCDQHANGNPCDGFKIFTVTAGNGQMTIVPFYRVNVPQHYMYPVKVSEPQRVIKTTNDTLYFYYKVLFKGRNFPYRIEMREQFDKAEKFNTQECKWFVLTPASIKFVAFVEERSDFTAILLALNTSYGDDFPEYQFVYVPSVYILSR